MPQKKKSSVNARSSEQRKESWYDILSRTQWYALVALAVLIAWFTVSGDLTGAILTANFLP